MDLEFEALNQRETWVLVPQPQHTNIVTCRCIFTLKYNPDGTINRHKARLVADVSFLCVVKTQIRWSNKIYKTELTNTR